MRAWCGRASSLIVMATTIDSLMEALNKTLDESAARIDRVHGLLWEARAEVVRNLVAVGAAILAGTITFLDASFISHSSLQVWLLITSWTLLLISILSGLFVLWQSITLRSFYPKLFNNSTQIRKQFEALNLSNHDAADKGGVIIKSAVDAVVEPIGRADKCAQVGAGVCLSLFFCSMLCFMIFAGLRFAAST